MTTDSQPMAERMHLFEPLDALIRRHAPILARLPAAPEISDTRVPCAYRKPISSALKRRMRLWREAGLSIEQIAHKAGVSWQTALKYSRLPVPSETRST